MDNTKIGELICRLRKEQVMTQLQLAEKLCVSDKAVSKWERGLGCPDVSLLTDLSDIFNIHLEQLLLGELNTNHGNSGNMKRAGFYICPICRNIITSMSDAAVSCCGKKLNKTTPVKASDSEKLLVEIVESDYFISSSHEMSREHYISFVALVTGSSIMMFRQYPEWELQARIPMYSHGRLMWHCTKHGLFYMDI